MSLPAFDELSGKTRAAIEAVDPVAFLLAEHWWLRSVIEFYRPLSHDRAEGARLYTDVVELKALLELHIKREEEAYFPAIEAQMQEAGQGSTFDMYGEHDAIRIRLEQLLTALERNEEAGSPFAALARSLLIHFENEEELIFDAETIALSPEARSEILRKFEQLA